MLLDTTHHHDHKDTLNVKCKYFKVCFLMCCQCDLSMGKTVGFCEHIC